MNKIIKRILIALGILIGIIILFFAGIMIKAKSELKKMTPLETQKITDTIYSIKDGYVNMYLIESDSGYILIDAGNDLETIKEEMLKLIIEANEVIALLLTHTDFDHVASIPLFRNAEIYLSKQEEQLINGETSRFFGTGTKIECDEYNLVDDNQIIRFSDVMIKCILSPGHTPGTTCYLINDRYLFTGDALSLRNGKVDDFIHMFNMDTKLQRESIDKLSRLENIDYIFTAHHGLSNDFEYAFKDWEK